MDEDEEHKDTRTNNPSSKRFPLLLLAIVFHYLRTYLPMHTCWYFYESTYLLTFFYAPHQTTIYIGTTTFYFIRRFITYPIPTISDISILLLMRK